MATERTFNPLIWVRAPVLLRVRVKLSGEQISYKDLEQGSIPWARTK